jgi:hypothetical protein
MGKVLKRLIILACDPRTFGYNIAAALVSRRVSQSTENQMYRIHKTLPWAGAACVLAVTMACSSAPSSPASPGVVNSPDGALGPDNSTLKVSAPSLVSPTGDIRLTSRQPTMTVNNARGNFAGGGFTYEFEVLSDGMSRVAGGTVPSGSSTTTWAYTTDLEKDTPYRWRARARMGAAFGPWSPVGRFITVKENRAELGPNGRAPYPSWAGAVVHQIASQRPDLLGRSCQEHGGTWEFMDLVIDTLRLQDTRWGYNWKRGNVGDASLDVINYHYGPGPDEGARDNWTFDIILGHCGSPSPAFIDLTDPNGAGSMWTSRGRW